MGCFLACFGASKSPKRHKNSPNVSARNPISQPDFGYLYQPIQPAIAAKQESLEKPIRVVPESRLNPEEKQLSPIKQVKPEENQPSSIIKQINLEDQLSSGSQKRVTFDSNVKEYEHISADEAPEIIEGSEKDVVKCPDENREKPAKSASVSDGGSTLSSLSSYPPNHRYQNCRESDDEDELDCESSDDLDDDEDPWDEDDDEELYHEDEYCDDDFNSRDVQEFSAGSCSSMESRTKSFTTSASPDKEAKTPRDRGGYVHSVLNPVENTTHWKAMKARATPPLKTQKENFPGNPTSKQFQQGSTLNSDELKKDHEVAVNASLSTWLVPTETTPPKKTAPISLEPILSGGSASSHGSNSIRSQEERSILGGLTVEEIRNFSSSSSPRTTPGEDSGSASSFKGIPNTTSKYREDKRVNWHSTPFETRLERALNKGAAET